MSDKSIQDHINALIEEEHQLRSGAAAAPEQATA